MIDKQSGGKLIERIDWPTILLYAVLVLTGWLTIFSTTYDESYSNILFDTHYGKQALWIFLSVVAAVMILIIDSKFFTTFAFPIYGLGMLLLCLVLLFGSKTSGSTSWLSLGGGFKLQPSEFAKFVTCLAVAKFASNRQFTFSNITQLTIVILLVVIPFSLTLLQGDMGSALIFSAFALMLYREGLSGSVLLIGGGGALFFILALLFDQFTVIHVLVCLLFIGTWLTLKREGVSNTYLWVGSIITLIIAAPLFIKEIEVDLSEPGVITIFLGALSLAAILFFLVISRKNKKTIGALTVTTVVISFYILGVNYMMYSGQFLRPHQRDRIEVTLGIKEDKQSAGYNVNQSLIAIGSGGLTGKGFLNGTQTRYDFVPEQPTDFIFCTLGEEFGFAGSAIVVVLFILLLIRLVRLAERQRSRFSRIYGYGVASIMFLHFAINVGMTIGITPVIGIPLPFFSYGGSSLLAFTILLFAFLKFDSERLLILH